MTSEIKPNHTSYIDSLTEKLNKTDDRERDYLRHSMLTTSSTLSPELIRDIHLAVAGPSSVSSQVTERLGQFFRPVVTERLAETPRSASPDFENVVRRRRGRPSQEAARNYESVGRLYVGHAKYQCQWQDCRWIFASKALLRQHVESRHSDLRRFHCQEPGCTRSFKTKGQLKSHTTRVHPGSIDGVEPPPTRRRSAASNTSAAHTNHALPPPIPLIRSGVYQFLENVRANEEP